MEYTNSMVSLLIDEHIHSARNREILKRRLIDGIVIEKLAEEYELSPRQIKNILRKGEAILFRKLP